LSYISCSVALLGFRTVKTEFAGHCCEVVLDCRAL